MRLIEREELKRKLDDQEDVKLVCALSGWAFNAMHIPGSIHVENLEMASSELRKDDQIVVYCTSPSCLLSVGLYHQLVNDGYEDVCRYAGGLEDWEEAGYPLAGSSLSV